MNMLQCERQSIILFAVERGLGLPYPYKKYFMKGMVEGLQKSCSMV